MQGGGEQWTRPHGRMISLDMSMLIVQEHLALSTWAWNAKTHRWTQHLPALR